MLPMFLQDCPFGLAKAVPPSKIFLARVIRCRYNSHIVVHEECGWLGILEVSTYTLGKYYGYLLSRKLA